jgi:hypothetical protein
MKKLFNVAIILVIVLFVVSTLFTSCKEIDDGNRNDITPITITTTSSNVKLEINLKSYSNSTFHSGQTIDWGDGSTPEPISESSKDYEYWHTYTSGGTHTITIMSEVSLLVIKDITLIALDISKSTTLSSLWFYNIDCTNLDVKYDNDLGYYGFNMWCYDSRITSLDLRKCTPLRNLHIYSSQIITLNASKCDALWKLELSGQIATLDVSGCTALSTIYCRNVQMTSLNASNCTALESLNCSHMHYSSSDTCSGNLTTLNVNQCTALRHLDCSNWGCSGQLKNLYISSCPALDHLSCSGNQLTKLDVNNCPALMSLHCSDNHLTTLDVSKCTTLWSLSISKNFFSVNALNTLFGTFHSNKIPSGYEPNYPHASIGNNFGTDGCDISIAENKGWKVYKN